MALIRCSECGKEISDKATNVSRVSEQRLFIAQNTILKEVLNQHLKVTNSTIRVKEENYTRSNFESRIKRKIAVFDT